MKRQVLIDWENKIGNLTTTGQTSRTYEANCDTTAIKKARVWFAKKFGKRGYRGTLFQVNHGDSITAVLPAQQNETEKR
jgi:hypothetical protein